MAPAECAARILTESADAFAWEWACALCPLGWRSGNLMVTFADLLRQRLPAGLTVTEDLEEDKLTARRCCRAPRAGFHRAARRRVNCSEMHR